MRQIKLRCVFLTLKLLGYPSLPTLDEMCSDATSIYVA